MAGAKGEWEQIFGGPWGGIDYSRPYNVIEKNSLAPGSVNTQQINGFLTSSPWVASSPYSTTFAAGEVVFGIFEVDFGQGRGPYAQSHQTLIVTNQGVYESTGGATGGAQYTPKTLHLVHAWAPGEVEANVIGNGSLVTFVQLWQGATSFPTIFFTAHWLNGVFKYAPLPGGAGTLTTATLYVCGAYLIELSGRLVIGECRFPTGGGPSGVNVLSATIAWSGVGAYEGAGVNDPWNPANFATLLGNVGGFNLLTDVPDQVTGLASMGRSALIFRDNGISQMDPGPSGIDPWLFYHLWNSVQGVGASPNTVSQFGETCVFLSSNNVYVIGMQSGVSPLGDKIIAKILEDARIAGLKGGVANDVGGAGTTFPYWYVSNIVNIAGELHYLLVFSSFTVPLPDGSLTGTPTCYCYDLNMSEGGWNFWDFGQYFQQDGTTNAGFLTCSFPPTRAIDSTLSAVVVSGTPVGLTTLARHLLFGAYTAVTTPPTPISRGQLFQLVPLDYDANTNPYSNYWAPIYPPLAIPGTTIKFRGEVISIGHKVTFRRLRMQSMNAPFPATVAGEQQHISVTFTGSLTGPQSSPEIPMDPDTTMHTYYGDVLLDDEMVQASINPKIEGTTPWVNLAMLRLSTVSLVGNDTKGSTM